MIIVCLAKLNREPSGTDRLVFHAVCEGYQGYTRGTPAQPLPTGLHYLLLTGYLPLTTGPPFSLERCQYTLDHCRWASTDSDVFR